MNRLSSADPGLRQRFTALVQIAKLLSPNAYVSSVKRSSQEQKKLYADWVAGRSKYPAAAPGTSKHERGRALDIGGMSPAQLAYLGRVWRSWGGRWGGNFTPKDVIHFEA